MKERIARALQSSRTALHIDSAILAVRGASELRQIVETKIDVVGHHKVDKTIAIVVAERRSRRPPAVRDAGFGSYIGKRAVAIVVIQDVAAETSDYRSGQPSLS